MYCFTRRLCPANTASATLGRTRTSSLIFLSKLGRLTGKYCRSARQATAIRHINVFLRSPAIRLLISPERLVDDGLLDADMLAQKPEFAEGRTDYGGVYDWKNWILPEAYKNFLHTTSVDLRGKFETFSQENESWLDDYAMYKAVKASQGQRPWYEWPSELKLRDAAAISSIGEKLYDEIQAEKFYQFAFYRQWSALKEYANHAGIKIAGDVPIFIALDSSDVWCNQDKFKLNGDGSPKFVAGVPPDYFSMTGQLLGQSDLRLGRDAIGRFRVVEGACRTHVKDRRRCSRRPFSGFCCSVGSSGQGQDRRERPMGRRARRGTVPSTARSFRRTASVGPRTSASSRPTSSTSATALKCRECEYFSSLLAATRETTICRTTTLTIAWHIPAHMTMILRSAGGNRRPAQARRGTRARSAASTTFVLDISRPTVPRFIGTSSGRFGRRLPTPRSRLCRTCSALETTPV